LSLNEIKKKKLEELKETQAQQEQAMEIETQIETQLKEILEPQAKERLTRVRMINNQRYSQVVSGLIQLNQSKRLEKKISDKELKKLLEKLSEKKEITIKRK
jgi:programmed cell death protein 5